MYCVECFMRDGNPYRDASFIVNGHSVCQSHVHIVIVEPEHGWTGKAYAWTGDESSEPLAINT